MKTSMVTKITRDRNISLDKACELIKNAGFDGVDFNLDLSWNRKEIENGRLTSSAFENGVEDALKYYKKDLETINKYGLEIMQAHAPFPVYRYRHPEINDFALKVCKNCILFCEKVGIKYLVMHGPNQSAEDVSDSHNKNVNRALSFFSELIPVLLQTNVTVCIENLFVKRNEVVYPDLCCTSYEVNTMVDSLNLKAGKDCFGFCFDSGHYNMVSSEVEKFILEIGPRLKVVHLHDNLGNDDSHRMPYAGNINWDVVLGALKKIGFNGSVNFETHAQIKSPRVPDAIAEKLMVLMADIARDFAKILEK